jgi:CheY-like chemotaxis protein
LLGYLLERAGAVVELAENGREALARAATTDYDLILMDIRMPEMDGLEATRALRDLDNPKRASVMVIGMSADFHSGNQEEYREAGMDGILGKPFRIDRLCRLLEQNAAPEPRVASGEPALLEWKRLILLREQLDVDTYLDFLRDGECAISAALDELAQLEQAGERDQLAQRAHRLAGLAAALGVERLQAGCRRLEENAQGGESVSNLASDYAEARELLRRLAE